MIKVVNGVETALTENEISAVNAEYDALQDFLIRSQRDSLLQQSDVFALSDRITDEMITYRQSLRDVPAQDGFPSSVNWPTKPE
jgi:hypothetical protein